MAITYDTAWPTDRDWVRFRIGDTSTADGVLQDAEITSALSEYGSKQEAAWRCSEAIFAEYSRLATDSKMGQVQHKYSSRAEWYEKLTKKLEAEAVTSDGVALWFGAESKADKETQIEDNDRVEPSFARGQFSTPGFDLEAAERAGSTS